VTGATIAGRLPQFPWDQLEPYRQAARAHPDGIIDLSVGSPVDPVPAPVREALAAAAGLAGYPATHGTPELREAAAAWLARRHGVTVSPAAILPVIGAKELVASLPALLGCAPGDLIALPALAYPTYDIGARLAGAVPVACAGLPDLGPAVPRLAWLNTPANPTGQVLTAGQLRQAVTWARARGTVIACDECYLELGFDAVPISVLHPDACDGSHHGLLAVHSLSKWCNLASYRAGFVTGDPDLVAGLLEVRKHAGLMVPGPVQAAMTAAFGCDAEADLLRASYAARRAALQPALRQAGWAIEHSEAGLYLWAAHPSLDGWASVRALAQAGILVAPGLFYGQAGGRHIRVALTASDERIAAAAARLKAGPYQR
jgi:succinyldiaminopimelate transaminase